MEGFLHPWVIASGGTVLADIKRIYKLRQGKIIDGVCGGVARYVGIEAIWVRIGWAALSLAGGIGIVAYLLGMYLFPRGETDETQEGVSSERASGPLVTGILLVSVGVLIVLRAIGVLGYGFWGAWHIAWFILWPLLLIVGGLFLLLVYWRQNSRNRRGFQRLTDDRMALGLCSGLGQYFKTDPNMIRFLFALAIILSRGVGLVIYVLIGLLTPEARDDTEIA